MIVIRNTSDWASSSASARAKNSAAAAASRVAGAVAVPIRDGEQPDAAAADLGEVLLDELPGPVAGEQDAVGQDLEMVAGVDEPRQRDDPARPSGRHRSGCGSSGARTAAA